MGPYCKIRFRWLFPVISLFILFSFATGVSSRVSTEKTLLIGSNKDFSPFEFENKKGNADGYSVDLMNAVAKKQNLKIRIILDTWSNIYNDLEDGKVDAVTGMLYSKERDESFDFSAPTFIISYALFKRKETDIESLDELMGREVITVKDVYAYEWLRARTSLKSIISVKSPAEALQLLASGKHDCVILPRLHGVNLLDDLKIDNVESFGPPVLNQKFCFAVANGNSDLLAELNDGLFSLQQSGEYDDIYLKWISVSKHSKMDRKVRFYASLFFAVIVFALISIGFWNWLLKRTVRLKTKEIRQNEARLNDIIEGIPIPSFVVDENHTVTHWNKACELLTGKTSVTMVGTRNHHKVLYDNQPYSIVDLLLDKILAKSVQQHDGTIYRESLILPGAYETEIFCSNLGMNGRWLYGSAVLLRDEAGKVNGAIETWQDLTESKQLERQLVQTQKMEALGTLAGGIAHDFNNILSAVIGNAELTILNLPNESALNDNQGHILAAARRAKNLVKQILTFSRQAEVKAVPVHVCSIVKEALELVTISLPANISVTRDIQSDALVMADASHLHQIVMNLCTNAFHAMKDSGGILKVRLNEERLEENQTGHEVGLIPGEYVKLTVRDSGHGIPIGIQDKILDPFFTTKKRGEGTGMGLSVTHGIVRQYSGQMKLDSAPGKGSTFCVYLPKYIATPN